MPLVLAFDDIKPSQIKRNIGSQDGPGPDKPASTVFKFCWATKEKPVAPGAVLVRYDKGTKSAAHFHWTDQFNIVVEGKGMFGRHELGPYHLHFSRAFTPYGPLLPDKDVGWAFMTLRTRYEAGSQRMPDAYDKLKKIPDRRPWHVTRKIEFPVERPTASVIEIPDVKDERGLFAHSFTLAPDSRMTTPSAAKGDGQYVVVLKGSLLHDHKHHHALTVVFIKPGENAFEICAGSNGLQGLVLNFPEVDATVPGLSDTTSATRGSNKWHCALCAFEYDEAQGVPADGIAPGTRWEEVPAHWTCPDCSASKADFEMSGTGSA